MQFQVSGVKQKHVYFSVKKISQDLSCRTWSGIQSFQWIPARAPLRVFTGMAEI